jgi:hypothetical protein
MSKRQSPNRSSSYRRTPPPGRGPSRPVDPRRAPYAQQKRTGIDPFAMGLIVVSSIVVLIIVLLIALQANNPNPGTVANNPSQPANNQPGVTPNLTQTAVAFATLTAPDVLPRTTVAEAKALYDANNITLVDVREAERYNEGHIKGAISVPFNALQTTISEVPKTGNVVLYCQ